MNIAENRMLQVGQELWYCPADKRYAGQARSVRVMKVGRKWADLEPPHIGRVNIQTLWIDGGGYTSPGRCWLTRDDYDAEVTLSNAWIDFKNRLPWSPPDGVDMAKLKQIKALLGFGG